VLHHLTAYGDLGTKKGRLVNGIASYLKVVSNLRDNICLSVLKIEHLQKLGVCYHLSIQCSFGLFTRFVTFPRPPFQIKLFSVDDVVSGSVLATIMETNETRLLRYSLLCFSFV
jgi:hypothetical protein